ncbi:MULTISPECIES: TetR/AcrR family transcriptional regulator [Eubacteriales]|uniref:TetR family transcriptional regulator n=1 Tax=Bittarella massiliensis (ex Durand et al. 2017) TaxID=1720313 RepID=A0AAQ1MCP4_9FIRM|nr:MULTISPECIES: TetR/AcrR family transcriptional regulator [Eubacteriales]ERJ00945.1 transcriptional regulator, TetR family [Clostridium sp. ATCC 29733]MZL69978.1 TetR family transcriptional regulator [Bittarella massiliensis (ex Durand et al. 2017)]MZL80624.1 TetR family transcriptional regulator [Bittarella massiliensis (ex Durand et al. 2017)]SHG00202.1 transcriptional regulator, TetR family [Bittarella massiliensis (ex Durand et al. 2017)]
MKREEKNLISRQKIMDSARREFAEKGYGLSSTNAICAAGEISKGILYHYFQDKDALYLACVQACFDGLTAFLQGRYQPSTGDIPQQLNRYFSARLTYFEEHPEQQRIFCEAVIAPPEHLRPAIEEARSDFDRFNIEILDALLSQVTLRGEVSRSEVIETFRLYQDFINARFQMSGGPDFDLQAREQFCQRAVLTLLYGVIEPGEEENTHA